MNNKPPMIQQIKERVVDPVHRSQLFPDSGVATYSPTQGPDTYSSGTDGGAQGFASFLDEIGDTVKNILGKLGGLASDEVYVDVMVRTPYGNKKMHLPLATNFMGDNHTSDVIDRLKKGYYLEVKIIYDGGKAVQATGIPGRFFQQNASDQVLFNNLTGNSGSSQTFSAPIDQMPHGPDATGSATTSSGPFGQFAVPYGHILTQYQATINAASAKWSVDANLIAAIIMAESGGNYRAQSVVASGLMQMIPSTFDEEYAAISSVIPGLPDDVFNPKTNIWCGSHHIKTCMNAVAHAGQQASNVKLIAAAYNAGEGNKSVLSGQIPQDTDRGNTPKYVNTVNDFYIQFSSFSTMANVPPTDNRIEVTKTDQTGTSTKSALGFGKGIVF